MFPFLAMKIFFAGAGLFFIVFWILCANWTGRGPFTLSNMVGTMMISLLYTFKILVVGALLFAITYLAWFYLI